MIFYFLLTDSRCICVESDDYKSALFDAFNKFRYDDYFEFIDDLNLVEWKDGTDRVILNYITGVKHTFDRDSKYHLESFTNIRKTKRPKRQLEEEFDEID